MDEPTHIIPEADAVHVGINAIRTASGLPPLEGDATVAGVALDHALAMARERFFSHGDALGRGALERLLTTPNGPRVRLVLENLGYESGFGPAGYPTRVVDGWMNSPPHRDAVLDPRVTHVGIGLAGCGADRYACAVFVAWMDDA